MTDEHKLFWQCTNCETINEQPNESPIKCQNCGEELIRPKSRRREAA